jgi:hypothetical protein
MYLAVLAIGAGLLVSAVVWWLMELLEERARLRRAARAKKYWR